MGHDTTISVSVRTGLPRPLGESVDNGTGTGRLSGETEGQRFRVQTTRFAT
jgi:hypothetical protein